MTARHLLVFAMALLTTGCLGSADSQKADAATARFYQLVAAKQYEQIYTEASPDLKSTTSLADFITTMQNIDNVMGACQAPVKRLDIHTNSTANGFFRDQGYTRSCANGPLTETVTIVVRNGVAQLSGYKFSSTPDSGS